MCEFGENVIYLRQNSKGKDKFGVRWEDGIWLGIHDQSNEAIIGTRDGVVKARDVKRKATDEERWNGENFDAVKGVPWEPVPGRGGIELRSRVHIPEEAEEVSKPMSGEPREFKYRRARITKEDIRKAGFTEGCPGCKAVNRGLKYHEEHTE